MFNQYLLKMGGRRGEEWLNKRVNLSLISIIKPLHLPVVILASEPPLQAPSGSGACPGPALILLMRAAMVGMRSNIRTAMAYDTKIVRYSMARLININSLIRLNSLETNPNGLRLFNNSDPWFVYITEHVVHIEDISQHNWWTASTFFHDTLWVHDFLVGGLYIAGKTIIILPQFKLIRVVFWSSTILETFSWIRVSAICETLPLMVTQTSLVVSKTIWNWSEQWMISGCAVVTKLSRWGKLIDPRIITGAALIQKNISAKGTSVATHRYL